MNIKLCVLLALCCVLAQAAFPEDYRGAAETILAAAQHVSLEPLEYMCDMFGHRYRGTPGLEQSIDYVVREMQRAGLRAAREPVTGIVNWVRGAESLTMLSPRRHSMSILGLGTSVGGNVTAEVIVVTSFDDLAAKAALVPGKIVLYNVPFTTYGKTAGYRVRGAAAAAKYGAVAALVRSVASFSLYTPHTGVQAYSADVPAIPVASVTVEDAALVARLAARGVRVVLQLSLGASTAPPVASANVVADLAGAAAPHEVVVLGGHMDSWDVGQGAIDDGAGMFSAWQAVALLQSLVAAGALPRPRRTVRALLWVDEEIGQQGARTYLRDHKHELPDHIIAMESDSGNFECTGFGFSGLPEAMAIMKQIGSVLLSPIGSGNITEGGEDTDNGFLCEQGVPCASLQSSGFGIDGYYFYFHHTQADTVDHLRPAGVRQSVAAYAVLSYVLADMPTRLPSKIARHK